MHRRCFCHFTLRSPNSCRCMLIFGLMPLGYPLMRLQATSPQGLLLCIYPFFWAYTLRLLPMRLQPSNYWGLSGACLHWHLLTLVPCAFLHVLSWLENAELFRAKTSQSPRTGDDNICIELLLRGRGGESQNLSGQSQNKSSAKPFDWKKKWNREIAAENPILDLRS